MNCPIILILWRISVVLCAENMRSPDRISLFSNEVKDIKYKCIIQNDTFGKYYYGNIAYTMENEKCEFWKDFYPTVVQSHLTEKNYCRYYLSGQYPCCLVNGTLKRCLIPRCHCYSEKLCIGPRTESMPMTLIGGERYCRKLGANGLLHIKNLLDNKLVTNFIREHFMGSLFWLSTVLIDPSPNIVTVDHINTKYLSDLWHYQYPYHNFNHSTMFSLLDEPITPNLNKLCVVIDTSKEGGSFWKMEFCDKKHGVICDFSNNPPFNENLFEMYHPPVLSLWHRPYIGNVDKTIYGTKCQAWNQDYPNFISDAVKFRAIRQYDIVENHNYCRSIDNSLPVCMPNHPAAKLTLCGVNYLINIAAIGKPSHTIDIELGGIDKYPADLAIDKDPETCSQTVFALNPQWELKFESRSFIKAVSMTFAFPEYSYQMEVSIDVFTREKSWVHCDKFVVNTRDVYTSTCNIWGIILRVQSISIYPVSLSLCEIEVYVTSFHRYIYNVNSYKGVETLMRTGEKCNDWINYLDVLYFGNMSISFPEIHLNSTEIFNQNVSYRLLNIVKNFLKYLTNKCRYVYFHSNKSFTENPVCLDQYSQFQNCAQPISISDLLNNHSCSDSLSGSEYMGSINYSISGRPCLQNYLYLLQHPNLRDKTRIALYLTDNYCRNFLHRERGPYCFVQGVYSIEIEYCKVPSCINVLPYYTKAYHSKIINDIDVTQNKTDGNYLIVMNENSNATTPPFITFEFDQLLPLIKMSIYPNSRYIFNQSKPSSVDELLGTKIYVGETLNTLYLCNTIGEEIIGIDYYIDCFADTRFIKIEAASPKSIMTIFYLEFTVASDMVYCHHVHHSMVDSSMCNKLRNIFPNNLNCNFHPENNCKSIYYHEYFENTTLTYYCEFPECSKTILNYCAIYDEGYYGNMDVTAVATICEEWYKIDPKLSKYRNFCRYYVSEGEKTVGCYNYISYIGYVFQYCKPRYCYDIAPMGSITSNSKFGREDVWCKSTKLGESYVGFASDTNSGQCVQWDFVQMVFKIPWNFPKNYCRNPKMNDKEVNSNGPFCYVESLTKEIDNCNISTCDEHVDLPVDVILGIMTDSMEKKLSSKNKCTYVYLDSARTDNLTILWSSNQSVFIVGIRLYPSRATVKDYDGLSVSAINTNKTLAKICGYQHGFGNFPFMEFLCLFEATQILLLWLPPDSIINRTIAICQLKIYTYTASNDCYNYINGTDYNGDLNLVPSSQYRCLEWNQSHLISQSNTSIFFPEGEWSDIVRLFKSYTFCRNPVVNKKPVFVKPTCFTSTGYIPCDIDRCQSEQPEIHLKVEIDVDKNYSLNILCYVKTLLKLSKWKINWFNENMSQILPRPFSVDVYTVVGEDSLLLVVARRLQYGELFTCIAVKGTYNIRKTYEHNYQECIYCLEKIKKYCYADCYLRDGHFGKCVFHVGYQMICTYATVNLTIYCLINKRATVGVLWQPVDVCTHTPIINIQSIINPHRFVHSISREESRKMIRSAYSHIPAFIYYFLMWMIFMFAGVFYLIIHPEIMLRWLER